MVPFRQCDRQGGEPKINACLPGDNLVFLTNGVRMSERHSQVNTVGKPVLTCEGSLSIANRSRHMMMTEDMCKNEYRAG